MAPIRDGVEPRYKLSKPPRTRTIAVTPSPGESRSDLDTSFNSESPLILDDSLNTIKSQHSRRSIRESVYGDGKPLRRELDVDEENEMDTSKSMRKKFSGTNTTMSKRASMRISLGLSRSSTIDPRDGSVEREIDQNISDTIKRKAQKDKLIALNQSLEATIDDHGIQERIISPIRRRSFFTPGLATRNPVDMLAKPPKPTQEEQAEFEYYYNPQLSVSSPLERIAALDLANRPITPLSRAATPADLDYGLIGRLRITNGMASPAPSNLSHNTTVFRNSIDYTNMPPIPSPLVERMKPLLQEARRSGEFTYEPESPIIQQSAEYAQDDVLIYSDVFGPPAIRPQLKEEYDFGIIKKRSMSHSALISRDKTSLMARNYMSDLADNPFGTEASSPVMAPFQATTKPSEMEAELFDELSLKQRYSSDSLKSLDLLLPDIVTISDDFETQTFRELSRVGHSSSTLNLTATESASHMDPISMCKTDSGYSSSSSTNSYRKNCGYHSGPDTIEVYEARSSLEHVHYDDQATIKRKRRPAPVTIPTTTTFQDSIFSSSIQSSTDTIATIATNASINTDKSQASTPKKLQKSRPRSQPPPSNRVAIQMHPEIDPAAIPYIPDELTARMAKRVAKIPPLDLTLPTIRNLRLEKADVVKAPLSAPLRFPSPQPTIDRVWDQEMSRKRQQPKSGRSRHSLIESLHQKKLQQKPSQPAHHKASMMSLGDIDSFLRGAHNTNVNMSNDLVPCRDGPAPLSKTRPTVPRTQSMTGLAGSEGHELSRIRSLATLTKAHPDQNSTREASSIYTDPSPTMTPSIWTDDTPELRQTPSLLTLGSGRSPMLDIQRKLSMDSNMTHIPFLPHEEDYTSFSKYNTSNGVRKSSSDKTLDDAKARGKVPRTNSISKDLPPLPSIPVATHVKMHEEKLKKSDSTKKALPPLPHQRNRSDHFAPRGLSPCRESGDWTASPRKWTRQRLPAAVAASSTTSLGLSATSPLDISMDQSLRIQSEPPTLPPLDWEPSLPQLNKSPSADRQPKLPQVTRSPSPGRQSQQSHHTRESKSPNSDYERREWTPDSITYQSQSPERIHYKWRPPKPDSLPKDRTEWLEEQTSPSPKHKKDPDSGSRHLSAVPQGLVARLSGHFEEASSYTHKPGRETGSSESRTPAIGLRKENHGLW